MLFWLFLVLFVFNSFSTWLLSAADVSAHSVPTPGSCFRIGGSSFCARYSIKWVLALGEWLSGVKRVCCPGVTWVQIPEPTPKWVCLYSHVSSLSLLSAGHGGQGYQRRSKFSNWMMSERVILPTVRWMKCSLILQLFPDEGILGARKDALGCSQECSKLLAIWIGWLRKGTQALEITKCLTSLGSVFVVGDGSLETMG